MSIIWTPDTPGFWETLHSTLPPNWQSNVSSDFNGDFGVRADSYCLEPLYPWDLGDYLEGDENEELINLPWENDDGIT